jgi:hypothetical protein
LAQAITPASTTIDLFTSLGGTWEGANAYAQNIDPNLSAGQYISSATISYNNVDLVEAGSTGHGYLYTDLLNTQLPGVTTRTDNDAPGDYWATQFSGNNITSLGDEYFSKTGTTLSWNIVLTGSELTALNSYLAAGSFNIGIDPDCHFTAGTETFTYTVATTSVPDTATTLFLLGSALLGLEVIRRKFALAR